MSVGLDDGVSEGADDGLREPNELGEAVGMSVGVEDGE
jgi:hypothetical protein